MGDVSTVTIKKYGRDMSLESIATNAAYRVDGVHMYADIQNLDEMLNVTGVEGTDCHKRTLRFLDQHYRAVNRILKRVDARRVDFHNQRLHSLFTKPYNSETGAEKKRVQRAVATAQLMINVLHETKDTDAKIPAAILRVGIDTGETLAVNNGRNGYREPLFLGDAANHAAKLASNRSARGIYLTNAARRVIGLEEVEFPEKTALSDDEIKDCEDAADLGVTADVVVDEWREDQKNNPLGGIEFTRHTPPFSTMDIASLTPANSRRQEAVSIYADIDGFTKYVAENIEANAENVVRVLHVLRAELERVLTTEFKGRRIRFIGDCIHGLICEGTAAATAVHDTISEATRLAGAFRSSFDLAIEKLEKENYFSGTLGLAVGFDYGPMTVTRLGVKGSRVRCSVSRGVLASEAEQVRCNGTETAIGKNAYNEASTAVRKLFGSTRKIANFDYLEATEALADEGEKSAGVARSVGLVVSTPAIAKAQEQVVRPYCESRRA
nr:adenylate/guanylate cyclase domain-containing protein [Pseudacidovorax sp. NFM-22]